ncbi:MAG: hypothetical protein ACSW8A_09760 [Lachnospiraceae bacterium]
MTYTSSDTKIATVSKAGKITAKHNHVANYRYGLPIRQLHLV